MNRRELLATVPLSMVGITGCVGGQGDGPIGESFTEGEMPTGDAVRWTYQTGGSVRNQPTIQNGVIYASGGRNDKASSEREYVRPEQSENVYAVSVKDGSELWRYEAPAGVMSSPVVREGVFVIVGWDATTHGVENRLIRIDSGSKMWETNSHNRYVHLLEDTNGTVYLGTTDDQYGVQGETLFAIRTIDGEQRWTVEAGDTTDALLLEDTLYIVEGGSRTRALAVSDGSESWHRDLGSVSYTPRVFDDTMFLRLEQANESGNYPVVAINATDGSERWRFSVPVDEPFVPTGAVQSGDTVCVTEYGGWLYGVNRADGTERWRYATDGDTTDQPVVIDGVVYFTSDDGIVHAIDAASGNRQWKQSGFTNPRIVAGNPNGLIVRSGKEAQQYLRAYTPDGTERWLFSHGGGFTQPAVVGRRAVIGTESGYIVLLDEQ